MLAFVSSRSCLEFRVGAYICIGNIFLYSTVAYFSARSSLKTFRICIHYLVIGAVLDHFYSPFSSKLFFCKTKQHAMFYQYNKRSKSMP
jgi:hypothetical protein